MNSESSDREVKKLLQSFVPPTTQSPAKENPQPLQEISDHSSDLAEEISRRSFQDVSLCYQCGKCSAGCPVRYYMDIAPNKIVRLVQLGYFDLALKSSTPWLCAGCLTCSTRCPNNFDLAKFMDALREVALERGVEISEENIQHFHKAFLNQIENHGRSYEAGLVAEYKLKSKDFLQDVESAPGMIVNGKLSLLPHNIKGRKEIKRIFKNTLKDK